MSVSKKGISSLQMARELGITQKSAWYMLQKLRECYEFSLMLGEEVEADETYIGGKEQNKHNDKKVDGSNKSTVTDLRDRDGIVVDDTTSDTLYKFHLFSRWRLFSFPLYKKRTVHTSAC